MIRRFLSLLLALTFILALGSVAFVFAADDEMLLGSDKSEPDSDYDGVPDSIDPAKNSNVFSGKLKSGHDNTTYSYTMDFRDFFDDNKNYHPLLAESSIVAASLANFDPNYERAYFTFDTELPQPISGGKTAKMHGLQLMEMMGFEDPVDYTLKEYNDDDNDEILIGHKTVTYGGVTKVILAVWVRGTRGSSTEEWSSNFNMGDLVRFFEKYDSPEGRPLRQVNDDWIRASNHRGFDVCANRLLKYIKTYYIDKYVKDELTKQKLEKPTYWITGHSRGASVSNVLASYLVDEGAEVFAYTFATPYSTANTEASAERYDCIFNLVNGDDFIPCLPMPEWGFTRYGKTAIIKASDYEDLVKEATGERYSGKYLSDEQMQRLIDKFVIITGENEDRDNPGKLLGWREIYVYHCGHNHPGETNGNLQETTIKGNVLGIEKTEYEGYAEHLKKYSYLTDDGICQIPAYPLQTLVELLAAVARGDIVEGALDYVGDNKLAPKFDYGKLSLLEFAFSLTEPHNMDTYSVIQTQINKAGNPGARFTTLKYYTAENRNGGRPAHTHSYEYVPYEGQEPTETEAGYGYKICHCSSVNPDYYDDIIKNVVIPATGTRTDVNNVPADQSGDGTGTDVNKDTIAKTGGSQNAPLYFGLVVFCTLGLFGIYKKFSLTV